MRVTAADGTQLDAAFDLEGQTYGADLILHSRSGSKTKNTRNPDYFAALEEILRRIGGLAPRFLRYTSTLQSRCNFPPPPGACSWTTPFALLTPPTSQHCAVRSHRLKELSHEPEPLWGQAATTTRESASRLSSQSTR